MTPKDQKRFWSKVDIQTTESCWYWRAGGTNNYGDGRFSFEGKKVRSSKLSLHLTKNIPLEEINEVSHTCKDKKCVNPAHLELSIPGQRTCEDCNTTKDTSEFYGYWKVCKSCASLRRKEKYASDPSIREETKKRRINQNRVKKLIVWDYLATHPCIDCGEKDPLVLEFDHLDQNTKSFEISELTRGWAVEKLLDEMAKCVIRCSNCHRKRTSKQLGWEIPYTDYSWEDIGNDYKYKSKYGPSTFYQYT